MNTRRAQAGFSLIEILVVLAIIGALVGLLLPAIQQVRESASLAECKNNLKQVGLAVQLYHDACNGLPACMSGNDGTSECREHLFYRLRQYLEQGNNDGTVHFGTFMCPSRRNFTAGARVDYGIADMWNMSGYNYVDPALYPFDRVPMIYVTTVPVAFRDITDGLGNTVLMAHKGLEPQFYYATPTPVFAYSVFQSPPGNAVTMLDFASGRDRDWSKPAAWDWLNGWDIARYPYCMLRDRDGGYDLGQIAWYPRMIPCNELLTSPHKNGMPCVWGDGSVRCLAYTAKHDFYQPFAEIGSFPSGMTTTPTFEENFNLCLWYGNDCQRLDVSDF